MNIEEQEKVLRNLFSSDISSLFNQKKEFEYSYCIWGTSVLFEIYPFDMERKNIKRGRKLAKTFFRCRKQSYCYLWLYRQLRFARPIYIL